MTAVLSADWVLPVEGPPIADGAVAIEDGRIAAVGTSAELGRGRHFPEAAILPGFVNAHTHLEYAVYGGFGDGLGDFAEWITLHIERKARIGWDDHVAIARAGAAECLASGVTTVGDCSYSGAAAVACAELGLRGTVYLEVFGTDPERALERFAATRERVEEAFSDRLRPGISPHAPYSTGIDVYRACAETGLPLATHLSESASELAYLRDGSGPWAGLRLFVQPFGSTGPRLLAEHGLLGPGVLAAHCVHVDEEEIELLAASGAAVVHCPRSNGLLGCGFAPLAALRRAGITVALGTDSPASAPSFDLFEELRAAVVGSRAREQRADALSGSEALELATLSSARAIGLEAEVGSLVVGKRADLTIVSMTGSPYLPWEDPAGAVVFGGSPERVITTLVDGEARYERGGTEWPELLRKAASARSRLLATPRSAPAVAS
ncbi:MAG TPA: amidohydrolase family protein [Gaiellaceae bacterium]